MSPGPVTRPDSERNRRRTTQRISNRFLRGEVIHYASRISPRTFVNLALSVNLIKSPLVASQPRDFFYLTGVLTLLPKGVTFVPLCQPKSSTDNAGDDNLMIAMYSIYDSPFARNSTARTLLCLSVLKVNVFVFLYFYQMTFS